MKSQVSDLDEWMLNPNINLTRIEMREILKTYGVNGEGLGRLNLQDKISDLRISELPKRVKKSEKELKIKTEQLDAQLKQREETEGALRTEIEQLDAQLKQREETEKGSVISFYVVSDTGTAPGSIGTIGADRKNTYDSDVVEW